MWIGFEWYMLAKGLHDYRTGKYADALATCRESRRRAPKSQGDPKILASLNLAIEAMALHRSGDEAGAKRPWQRRSRMSRSLCPASTAAGGRATG